MVRDPLKPGSCLAVLITLTLVVVCIGIVALAAWETRAW